VSAETEINLKARSSLSHRIFWWKPGGRQVATTEKLPGDQEKNAIFSAWLMRRIGASGSLAATAGFLTMPLAMIEEPSEISSEASGAAWVVGWAVAWAVD
jgi:hypothetical protein